MSDISLTIGQAATLACLLEVAAPKPGNVHRGADFEDLSFNDFLRSALAIGPAMESACDAGVGKAVFAAVQATRSLVKTNTNLGMVLLMAPLAAVPRTVALQDGIAGVLASLTKDDCHLVYEAIRLAQPGGLGKAPQMDVRETPPDDLLAAMRAAASRDLVARQYAENFSTVFTQVLPWLVEARCSGLSLTQSIVHTHVRLLAAEPDSLIARKCGLETARAASARAARALAAGEPGSDEYHNALADLDFWLRSDHHRRNPGTTADLVTAGLFAGLREGLIAPSE
jgi:triphosphoribosyl-dephospho-CoA synthase